MHDELKIELPNALTEDVGDVSDAPVAEWDEGVLSAEQKAELDEVLKDGADVLMPVEEMKQEDLPTVKQYRARFKHFYGSFSEMTVEAFDEEMAKQRVKSLYPGQYELTITEISE